MKRGGSCGCGSNPPKLFGGSPNLNDVPTSAYYPYNGNLANDPTSPANIQAARFAGDFSRTTGGRRRTMRRGRRLRQRGGVNFFNGLYNQMAATGSGMNHITSMGAVNGVNNQSNIITGVGPVSNTAVTSQPVLTQPYGFSNMPLA
jgi:hypothetical protein